jgi:hypothetical protein
MANGNLLNGTADQGSRQKTSSAKPPISVKTAAKRAGNQRSGRVFRTC